MKNELITITPATAQEWMKKNTSNNRSLRYRDVKKYANDIKNGNWKITHQGIAFDADGKLIDGQHRLAAIALAGMPVRMFVATGVDPSVINVVDSGVTRTMSDRMKVAGLDEIYRSTRSAAFVNAVNYLKFGHAASEKLSTCDMQEAIAKYYDACAYANSMKNSPCGSKAGVIVALISAMQTEWKSAVDAFVACVNHNEIGTGNYNWKAALNFSDLLRDRKNYRNGGTGLQNTEYEAEKAIWCFVHNCKRTNKPYPIYDLTERQLESFSYAD